jgi:hypothetical protein
MIENLQQEIDTALDSSSRDGIVLPSQYFGAPGFCSEQRLMLAVLVDAINILKAWTLSGSRRQRQAFAEASHWVIKRGTRDSFSFDSVCDVLGIGSEMARKRLRGIADGHKTDLIGLGHPRLKQFDRPQKIVAIRERSGQQRAAVRSAQ